MGTVLVLIIAVWSILCLLKYVFGRADSRPGGPYDDIDNFRPPDY